MYMVTLDPRCRAMASLGQRMSAGAAEEAHKDPERVGRLLAVRCTRAPPLSRVYCLPARGRPSRTTVQISKSRKAASDPPSLFRRRHGQSGPSFSATLTASLWSRCGFQRSSPQPSPTVAAIPSPLSALIMPWGQWSQVFAELYAASGGVAKADARAKPDQAFFVSFLFCPTFVYREKRAATKPILQATAGAPEGVRDRRLHDR